MSAPLNVHYGCGFSAPENWVNYDISPTLLFEKIPILGHLYTRKSAHKTDRFPKNVRYGNIIKGLPHPPNSVSAIYCSHVLEHLSYEDCLTALKNPHALLQKGGVFRFVLPDLNAVITAYTQETSPDAAHHFMKNSLLGTERRSFGLKSFRN